MMGLFHWIIIGQAGLALSFVMIYASGFAGGGIAAGVRLGIMLEILAVSARCAFYATQPFPAKLLVLISIGGFIEMIVTGVIVGAIYKSAAARRLNNGTAARSVAEAGWESALAHVTTTPAALDYHLPGMGTARRNVAFMATARGDQLSGLLRSCDADLARNGRSPDRIRTGLH